MQLSPALYNVVCNTESSDYTDIILVRILIQKPELFHLCSMTAQFYLYMNIIITSMPRLGAWLSSPIASNWWHGVVVSGVHRINEVNARRAWLVLGWVTIFGRVYHLDM